MFTKLNFIFKSKLWNRLGLINIWLMKKNLAHAGVGKC